MHLCDGLNAHNSRDNDPREYNLFSGHAAHFGIHLNRINHFSLCQKTIEANFYINVKNSGRYSIHNFRNPSAIWMPVLEIIRLNPDENMGDYPCERFCGYHKIPTKMRHITCYRIFRITIQAQNPHSTLFDTTFSGSRVIPNTNLPRV